MRWMLSLTLLVISILSASCGSHSMTSTPPIRSGGSVVPQVLQGGGQPLNWTRFGPNTYSGAYNGIVLGPDKNMWFVDTLGPGLVKMTMAGSTTEYQLPSAPSTYQPSWIALGPNSKFFISAQGSSGQGSIEFVNTRGGAASYPLPLGQGYGANIAAGPDGNAWVALNGGIVRVSPGGATQEYTYPGGGFTNYSGWIVSGPGGKLWYTDLTTESIGSIDPSTGTIVEFPVGQSCSFNALVAPPDGNLWFGCFYGGGVESIGRMTPSGATTFYSLPNNQMFLHSATVGPGGFPYFVVANGNNNYGVQPGLLRVNTNTGIITYIASPYGIDYPQEDAAGPDGNIWLSTSTAHIEVYILKILTVSPTSLNFDSPQLQTTITGKGTGKPTLSAASSNVGIATVAPVQNTNTFVVTSQAVGYCTITVQDTKGNSFQVPVTVQ